MVGLGGWSSITAAMGFIVPEYVMFLGIMLLSLVVKFSDIPSGLAAVCEMPGLGWAQIIFFSSVMDGKCQLSLASSTTT